MVSIRKTQTISSSFKLIVARGSLNLGNRLRSIFYAKKKPISSSPAPNRIRCAFRLCTARRCAIEWLFCRSWDQGRTNSRNWLGNDSRQNNVGRTRCRSGACWIDRCGKLWPDFGASRVFDRAGDQSSWERYNSVPESMAKRSQGWSFIAESDTRTG